MPELTSYDGNIQYASQVLQKAAEEQGTFAEKVHILVHASRQVGEHHQVLFSAISQTRWMEMLAYAGQADEAIPVYSLPGLALKRCTADRAVLLCFTAFLCLLWEEGGTWHWRTSPMGMDSDNSFILQNMVLQAAGPDEAARKFPYAEMEVFDFRDPALAAESALDLEGWWPKGLGLRAWFKASDTKAVRRQFEGLGELVEAARVADLCNPSAEYAPLLARQHWSALRLGNGVAGVAACAVAGLFGWQALQHTQQANGLAQRLEGLTAQAETLKTQTRPQAEANTQAEFLTQALTAGYRQPGALAEWLLSIKAAVPPDMLVLSLGLERDDKTPRKPGVAEPLKGIRLDAALSASVDNKSAVLSQFVRQLENQGFTVRSRRSPSAGGATGEGESSEVVTYLIDRSTQGVGR